MHRVCEQFICNATLNCKATKFNHEAEMWDTDRYNPGITEAYIIDVSHASAIPGSYLHESQFMLPHMKQIKRCIKVVSNLNSKCGDRLQGNRLQFPVKLTR